MVLFLCTFVLLACRVTMETSKFEEINSQIYLFENVFLVFDCFFSPVPLLSVRVLNSSGSEQDACNRLFFVKVFFFLHYLPHFDLTKIS